MLIKLKYFYLVFIVSGILFAQEGGVVWQYDVELYLRGLPFTH